MLEAVVNLYPDSDYLVLFLEDFFLQEQVDTHRIVELVRSARQARVGCLRLVADLPLALPPTYAHPDVHGVGVIASGEEYRVSLQASIWRIDTLRRLLAPGLSPWDFETIGTHLSELMDDEFWGVTKSAIVYDHAVEKGKWKPVGLKILREAGLHLSESNTRGVFSEADFASHIERGRSMGRLRGYRGAALRCFLTGRTSEGLSHIWRRPEVGFPNLVDVAFSAVGMMGASVTRGMLAIYVKLRLWSRARRVRGYS